MRKLLLDKSEIKQLLGCEIQFCRLTAEEYVSCYYNKMQSVGWKPIADSMMAHHMLAQDGLFCLKHNSVIIATLSAAKYPTLGVAYMGFYTVDKEWRHLGLGRYLWQQVAAVLEKEGYLIELDSPPELVPYYASLGYTECTIMTMRGLQSREKLIAKNRLAAIKRIDSTNLKAVVDYDQTIFPEAKRAAFLLSWIEKKHTRAVAHFDGSEVLGYGVMSKHFVEGYKQPYSYIIAPVYAATPVIAASIIQGLCMSAEKNELIFLDTLDSQTEAVNIANSLGFEPIFPAHRLSAMGKLDKQHQKVMPQVYALSSHAYAPL